MTNDPEVQYKVRTMNALNPTILDPVSDSRYGAMSLFHQLITIKKQKRNAGFNSQEDRAADDMIKTLGAEFRTAVDVYQAAVEAKKSST